MRGMFDDLKKKLAKASSTISSDEIIDAIKSEITEVVNGGISSVTSDDVTRLKAIITRGADNKEILKQVRFLLLVITNRKDQITINNQVSIYLSPTLVPRKNIIILLKFPALERGQIEVI